LTEADTSSNYKTTFLNQLRSATSASHKQLEELDISKSILKDDIQLIDYAYYLRCMLEITRFYEKTILPEITHLIPDATERQKSIAIENDLLWLKENNVTVNTPPEFKQPSVSNEAIAFGMSYVIEGSTLGGQFIIKHLQAKTPLTKTSGATYFNGYGSETGKRWQTFLMYLTEFAALHKNEDEIIAGAISGFDAIYKYFLNCQRNYEN